MSIVATPKSPSESGVSLDGPASVRPTGRAKVEALGLLLGMLAILLALALTVGPGLPVGNDRPVESGDRVGDRRRVAARRRSIRSGAGHDPWHWRHGGLAGRFRWCRTPLRWPRHRRPGCQAPRRSRAHDPAAVPQRLALAQRGPLPSGDDGIVPGGAIWSSSADQRRGDRCHQPLPGREPEPRHAGTSEHRLLYANPASRPILAAMPASIGEPIPDRWLRPIEAAVESGQPFEIRVEAGTYEILAVDVPDLGFVNLYGTDVTARKTIVKFPDRIRIPSSGSTGKGRIVYANPASGEYSIHRV